MEDVQLHIEQLEKCLEQFFDSFPQAKNSFVCETKELDERIHALKAEKCGDISVGHPIGLGTNHLDMFNVRLTVSELVSQHGFEELEVENLVQFLSLAYQLQHLLTQSRQISPPNPVTVEGIVAVAEPILSPSLECSSSKHHDAHQPDVGATSPCHPPCAEGGGENGSPTAASCRLETASLPSSPPPPPQPRGGAGLPAFCAAVAPTMDRLVRRRAEALRRASDARERERYGRTLAELEIVLRDDGGGGGGGAATWLRRRDVIDLLRARAPRNDPGALGLLRRAASEDRNVNLRGLAADAVAVLAMQDISSQIALLSHPLVHIRHGALVAVRAAADPSDPAAAAAVIAAAADPAAAVRRCAVEGIEELFGDARRAAAPPGAAAGAAGPAGLGPAVLRALLGRLEDSDAAVRQAAGSALVQLARPGDRALVQGVAARMRWPAALVRRAAVETMVELALKLGEVADPGVRAADEGASPVAQMKSLLLEEDADAQRAGVEALERVSSGACSLYSARPDVALANAAAAAAAAARRRGM